MRLEFKIRKSEIHRFCNPQVDKFITGIKLIFKDQWINGNLEKRRMAMIGFTIALIALSIYFSRCTSVATGGEFCRL